MAAFTAAEIDAMKGAQLRSESTAFGEDKTKQGASRRKYHQEVGPVEPKIGRKEITHCGRLCSKHKREKIIDSRSMCMKYMSIKYMRRLQSRSV